MTLQNQLLLVGVLAKAQVAQALGLRGRGVPVAFALSPTPRAGIEAGAWPRRAAGEGIGLAIPAMTPALRRYAEVFGLVVRDGVLGLAEPADDAVLAPDGPGRQAADGQAGAAGSGTAPAAAADLGALSAQVGDSAPDGGASASSAAPDPALVAAIARAILAHPADIPAATITRRLPQIGVAAASALRGAATRRPAAMLPAAAETVRLIHRDQPHAGFFAVDRLTLSHRRHDGGWTPPVTREVFVAGDAAVVLPWDRVRDRVLVIDQFRAAMVLRDEPLPWMIEPIAGRIDAGETPAEAAIREAREEANLTLDPAALLEGPAHYPSPGTVAEYIYSFVAPCDLPDGSAGLGGLASEAEDIRAHLIPRAQLTQMALRGNLPNGPLTLLALWLEAMAPRLGGPQPEAAGALR